jgi:asparagine synthetase B (glutamine-hydrolysing)
LVGHARFKKLFDKIATDHYATHPVYYHRGLRGLWIVGNDLRLILASSDVPAQIDRTACSRFLTRTVMVDENELANGATFFTAIGKLEPGSVLTIAPDGVTHRAVRQGACPAQERAPRLLAGRQECVEAFKEVFDRCVRDRMQAPENTRGYSALRRRSIVSRRIAQHYRICRAHGSASFPRSSATSAWLTALGPKRRER